MKLTRRSLISKRLHTMELPVTREELEAYYNGKGLVQDAFPHLTKEQREFILTGITPEEWVEHVAAFENEDESDEDAEEEGI